MTPVGLGDHVLAEPGGVVRAKEREGPGIGEGHIEQRLVQLALDDLGLAPARPDRFTDAPDARTGRGVRLDELPPRRYQAGGISADLVHVREVDVPGIAAELRSHQPDLLAVEGDDDRIVRLEGALDERNDARQELLLIRIEKRVVPEDLLGAQGAQAAADRCETTSGSMRAQPSGRK